jgi:hypothetical protein
MSVLFDNVKVGDTVHYSTPQGQSGKGKVVIHKGTHLVLNAGGKYGRPQVVTDKNYIKHSRDGKVIGALLSRLTAEERESLDESAIVSFAAGAAIGYAGMKAAMPKIKAYMKKREQIKSAGSQAKYWTDKAAGHVSKTKEDNRSKRSKQYHDKQARVAIKLGNDYVNKVATLKGKKVTEARQDISDPYNWDPVMRAQIFAAAAKENRARQIKKGQPVPHELDKGRTLKSAPQPFRRGVKEETVNELDNSTLASYTTKALADRKKAQSGFEMAGRIWDGERKDRAQAKAFARVSKRTVGIQKAIKKIATNLPAVKEDVVNEVSAPGKEAWIKANKARFIERYGKEKGLRVLYAKAWKDSKTNEARESEWTANQQLSGQASKSAKGHYLMRDGRKLSGPHSPEEAVKAYKNLSSQGTDTKGVKIVHVKETHMYEVSLNDLLAEAKVEKAAKLAISLKKKAKGNKHVETEPKLDIPDRTNTGTIEGNPQEQENAKV